MRIIALFFILLFFQNQHLYSQEYSILKHDSAKFEQTTSEYNFDETKKKEVKKDKQTKKKEEKNVPKFDFSFLKVPLYILSIVLLGFLVYFLITKQNPLNRKVSIGRKIDLLDIEEELFESDLEILLAKALKDENYQQALRTHYLIALRLLIDNGLVKWKRDKTNQHFVYELGGTDIQQPFRKLSLMFNQVWYGDIVADQEVYKSFLEVYVVFSDLILTKPANEKQ